ncbi:SH3 domain-containing protein [Marivirga sp.]|uniref:SH3 domain-containing protein n=1 Tax=Marivirga sp. TaxID=2018662 RepID=UPI002D7F786D|nr:SH3 domain-containing protein [Marivirga sp.]HET8859449.1 SH3 domain-containing protein [Marivirga sp.]
MTKFLIIFILLSVNMTFGQAIQNGLILPEERDNQEICCIYAPKEGFTIYNQPDGEIIGKLTRDVKQNTGDQSNYRIYYVDFKTKTDTQIDLQHFEQIGYEIWALKYAEKSNGFVKLRYDERNLWLKENDIITAGFELVDWQTFLSDNVENLLGFYANDPGLNLREQPSTDSKIIKTLKGETHQISPTKEHEGLWTKVKVIINKEHPCRTDFKEEENIIQELEGWIKIIDDNGQPNVWYYSRGC